MLSHFPLWQTSPRGKTALIAGTGLIIAGALTIGAPEPVRDALRFSSQAVAAETELPVNPGGTTFTNEQKKAIGELIRDYLVNHPDTLIEAQTALDAKLEKEQADKLKSFMSENAKDIYRSPESPVAGDPNGV